jgi:hypothetical protein
VQVADRFHLLMNVREAIEKVMLRQNRLLRRHTRDCSFGSASANKTS